MGDVDEVAAILDLITAIRPHVVEVVLEQNSPRLTIAQTGTYVDDLEPDNYRWAGPLGDESWDFLDGRMGLWPGVEKTPRKEGWYCYRDDDRLAGYCFFFAPAPSC